MMDCSCFMCLVSGLVWGDLIPESGRGRTLPDSGCRMQGSGDLACKGSSGDLCLFFRDGRQGLNGGEDLLEREAGFVKTVLTFRLIGLAIVSVSLCVAVEDHAQELSDALLRHKPDTVEKLASRLTVHISLMASFDKVTGSL